MSLQDRFNENRNVNHEDELNEVIRRQEAAIHQLQEQLQQQQVQQQLQQIQQLQQQQQQAQPQQDLGLTPKDLLTQFRQLRSLDRDHDATAFIASVEAVLALCPRENQQLINLATAIIMNEKISGDAGDYIRGLGTNATWDQIKAKLIDHHRPRTTYSDIFSRCRNVKVSNLRELFTYFEKSKSELNKIYMYDETRPEIYEPNRVDKDLVNILIEKIDIPLRSHSNQNGTLNEVITNYTRIRALDDPRTIHYRHRKKNQQTQYSTNKTEQTQNKQQTQYNNNNKSQQNNTNKPTQYNDNKQTQQYNKNQSGYYKKNYQNYKTNNSAQTKTSHMSVDAQQPNVTNHPTYMEVDTIQEVESDTESVNFIMQPLDQNSQ